MYASLKATHSFKRSLWARTDQDKAGAFEQYLAIIFRLYPGNQNLRTSEYNQNT